MKTTNPLPEQSDAEGGNDGGKSKEEAAASGESGDAKTDDTKAGGRRLEGEEATKTTTSTEGDVANKDATEASKTGSEATATTTKTEAAEPAGPKVVPVVNADEYWLPMEGYQDVAKPVAVLDAVSFFFQNKKAAAGVCGYTKCELLMPGCKDPYTGDKLAI